MPYISDTNFDPRFDRSTNGQMSGGHTGNPTAQMDDEDDVWSKQTYINHVYGGPVSNQPEVQQAIAKQYDYNKMRVLSGKDPLKIADVKWDPTSYDDLMNEWMAHRYEETGKLPRMHGRAAPAGCGQPSGEEQLDRYQEDASKKWRETFETAGTQNGSGNTSIFLANTGQQPLSQEQAQQKTLEAIQRSIGADEKKDFFSLTPQEVAAGVRDVMLRRAISEGPAALVNLHQRRAEEAGGLGALPPPASHQLKVEDMGPVFGRLLSTETGLIDGSAGWAIDLQNMINQGNPNTSSALDPFLKIKDELHKKYPGAFTTGYIAGTLASNYLYGAPAKAEEATGVALRRAASEEAAAAQQTATQAMREAGMADNPLLAALE